MPEIIVKLGDRVVQKYLLYKDQKLSIGRAPDNDIAIENPAVSRRHATVEMVNGRYILEDNNSANGSYVNGVRVTRTEILDKDIITIGKHKLHFYNQDAIPAASSAEPVIDDATMVVGEGGKPAPTAVLKLGDGKGHDQSYPLTKVETRIGRAADNDIRLHDWFVSKHHAVIGRKGSTYIVRDLDSWRHTMVNGQIVTEAQLKNGDEVQFGPKIVMRFEIAETGAEPGSTRRPVELADAPPQESELVEDVAAMEEAAGGPAAESEVAQTAAAPIESVLSYASEEPSAPAPEASEAPTPAAEPHKEQHSEEHSSRHRKKKKRRHHDAEASSEPVAEPAPNPAPEAPGEPVVSETSPEPQSEAPRPAEAAAGSPNGEADLSGLTDAQREEVAVWEKALNNPSGVIRKQAAKKLKQLTGRDYVV